MNNIDNVKRLYEYNKDDEDKVNEAHKLSKIQITKFQQLPRTDVKVESVQYRDFNIRYN